MKRVIIVSILGILSMTVQAKRFAYIFSMVHPVASNELVFCNDSIEISFNMRETRIEFSLYNKLNKPLKVDWQSASVVIAGEAFRVAHIGTRYFKRNEEQIPTTVPPGATIKDELLPTDNVYYREGDFGGWKEEPLFPVKARKIDMLKHLVGTSLDVYIPIIVGNRTHDYLFKFVITDVYRVKKVIVDEIYN